jgi:acyl carrier protein
MSIADDNDQRMRDVIGRLFEVDPASIADSTSQDTIAKWDSLGMVNLVSELELAFEIEFDLLEIADFKNVGLIKTILRDKGIDIA